jgi:hypothetical protein
MIENRLQDHLTRLEAGETLEAALTGLPADEADLVRLAAQLRALPQPARDMSIVNVQRARLLRAAQQRQATVSQPAAKLAPRWLWPVAAVAGAAILLFLCAALVLGGGALWWNVGARGVAQNPTPADLPVAYATPAPVVVTVPDAQTALLDEVQGLVEVRASDGSWQAAAVGAPVRAGQRVRTGALSGATLVFYDGSRARLGPNTEIAVDALDAPRSGRRVIRLTQTTGESDHEVAKSSAPDSQYEVATPSGVGAAKGTAFQVSVTAVLIRFAVSEGVVAVSNLNVTVIVVAGHVSVIPINQPPTPPLPRFSGEGEVQEISPTAWRIAGQSLAVNSETALIGEPQVGDWVAFEGRILADGTRLADRITLLRRAIGNTFTFVGVVEGIGAETWTISGRAVRVTGAAIEPGITVGNTVEVVGVIRPDGALQALSIRRLPAGAAETFSLIGVLQAKGDPVWTVSGITFTVTPSTTLDAGLVVGDVVRVTGVISDGTRIATSVQRLSVNVGEFEFIGVVLSTNPWNVSGVGFTTNAETRIDPGIQIGNRVRVAGRVLPDGTRLATEIEQLDQGRRHAIQFTARVERINPWVVGGVTVTVDSKTKIEGDIRVGDWVTVKGNLLPDGAVLAKKITRVAAGGGCTSATLIVIGLNGNTLTLSDGQTLTLDGSIRVTGQLSPASVVVVQTCAREDGSQAVVAIIVIFQLEGIPTPAPTRTPAPTSGCAPLLVIVNGQVSLPSGGYVTVGGHEVLLEVKLKDKKKNEAEIKITGRTGKWEVKVKVKDDKIEIKSKGNIAVGGAGKYNAGGTLTVQACAGQNGLVIVVNGITPVSAVPTASSAGGQVTLCHIPPGNPSKARTITVEAGAAPAHLAHGDTLGPCP